MDAQILRAKARAGNLGSVSDAQFRRLIELQASIGVLMTTEQRLQRIADSVVDPSLFPFTRSRIYMLDDERDALVVVASAGITSEEREELIAPREERHKWIAWQAFERGEIVNITDAPNDERVMENRSFEVLGRTSRLKAFAAVPLMFSEKVIGVLIVDKGGEIPVSSEELDNAVFRGFVSTAAHSIHDLLMVEEEQRLREALQIQTRHIAHDMGNYLTAIIGYANYCLRVFDDLSNAFNRLLSNRLVAATLLVQRAIDWIKRKTTGKDSKMTNAEKSFTGFLEEIMDSLSRILRAGKSVEDLRDQMLLHARLVSGAEEPSSEEHNISLLFNEILGDWQKSEELAERKADILLECPENAVAKFDKEHIKRIMKNLLENAKKYGIGATKIRGATKITVEPFDENGSRFFRIGVWDKGPGIEDDQKERVFGRFERGGRKQAGSYGLGLDSAKRLAELNRGRIWVEDNPEMRGEKNRGCVFYLTLPMEEELG